MAEEQVRYLNYIIKPKRDFPRLGFLVNGEHITSGFVVTDVREHVNVMPGATWFPTIQQAKIGCDALDLAKYICRQNEKDIPATFWHLIALSRQRVHASVT